MKRLLLLLCLLLPVAPASAADLNLTLMGVSGGATYAGQGDQVGSAVDWISCSIGYSASYATGSNKACNIRRASDNTTQDINILSTGLFDLASYNTFVGTDASGSCTIASTTLTCSGLGSALHQQDPISGVGIGQPCYLTAVGGFSAGAQTATINSSSICGTVGVAETVTGQVAGYTTKAYDQSGNSRDASQATAGSQFQLLPKCLNALPCWLMPGSGSMTATIPATAAPISSSMVDQRTNPAATSRTVSSDNAGNIYLRQAAANATDAAMSSSICTATAADNAWHTVQTVLTGPTCGINVDGTFTSGSTTARTSGTTLTIGGSVVGWVTLVGMWPVTFSSGQYGAICHNDSLPSHYNLGLGC